MKLPKLLALMMILGMLLQGAAFPQTAQGTITEPMEAPLSNTSRGSPLSTFQGGEQNIDPFVVHPGNRWDSATSGSFAETIADGELEFEGLINDSSTMERYRESSTADSDIGVRWRLNATADLESNETDWYTAVSDQYGADGFAWEEGAAEPGEAFQAGVPIILTHANGDLVGTINGAGGTFSQIRHSLTPFVSGPETDLYDQLVVRWKANFAGLRIGFSNGSGIGIDGGILLVATAANIFQTDIMVLDSDWTGRQQQLRTTLLEEDGQGNFDANEVFTIEYIRLVGDTEWAGDYEIAIGGLNGTQIDGTGNFSLNAYPFNATHYNLRPTVTTNDGTNWRSWNPDSDQQDWYQLEGQWGADGVEYVEGTREYFTNNVNTPTVTQQLGYIRTVTDAVSEGLQATEEIVNFTQYPIFKVKARANASVTLQWKWDTEFLDNANGFTTALTAEWQVFTIDTSAFTTDDDGSVLWWLSPTANEMIDIDYVRLLTNDDSSDLAFFAYEIYYRTEMSFDLRHSDMEFVVTDDEDDEEFIDQKIGEFELYDFFEEETIIPDVFAIEVGLSNFFFGVKTAGANVTMVWDYYEAEFSSFNFELDTWNPGGEQILSSDAYGMTSIITQIGQTLTTYNLTVPEFDACSGIFTISQNHTTAPIDHDVRLYIYSVNTLTGRMTEEMILEMEGTAAGYEALITADGAALTFPKPTSVLAAPNDLLDGEIGFSVYFDKQQRKLNGQIQCDDAVSGRTLLMNSANVSSTQSNEFVLRLFYRADHFMAGANAEVIIALLDWTLTFRDLFGLPIDLPDIGDVTGGGGIFDLLLGPIVSILNVVGAIPDAIGKVIGSLGSVLSQLTSIEGVLGLVTSAVDAIGAAITASVDAIGAAITSAVDLVTDAVEAMESAIETALEAVEDAVDLVTDAVDLVTTAVAALAAQVIDLLVTAISDIIDEVLDILSTIWTAIVTEIRAIDIQGVNVGGVLDLIFSFLGLYTSTAATTIAFLLMIVVEWSLIMMVFLFLAILFFSIGSSNAPGEVFGYVFKAYSVNTLPFSVGGFKMYVPLALWNLPFLAIVVLGIV